MGRSVFAIGSVLLLFFVGCIGFLTLIIGGMYQKPVDLTPVANQFLTQLNNAELQQARSRLAKNYSDSLSDEQWSSLIGDNELDQVKNCQWNKSLFDDDQATISGVIATQSGKSVPLQISWINENGRWLINGINTIVPSQATEIKPAPERLANAVSTSQESPIPVALDTLVSNTPANHIESDENPIKPEDETTASKVPVSTVSNALTENENHVLTVQDIPADAQAIYMAQHWTTQFFDAVATKDFKPLHSQLAQSFQDKLPLKKFTRVFSGFFDRSLDATWIGNKVPVLIQKPTFDADGVLYLKGHFLAQPQVNFDYAFVKQDSHWKPVAIHVEVVEKSENVVLPKSQEIKNQVATTTKRFGRAIAERDFGSFYRKTYSKFQDKFTLQQFRDYFGAFVENEVDLAWLRGIEPVFDAPPSINMNGFLNVVGHFPAEPVVNFRYAFVQEEGDWKVSTIKLSIPAETDTDDPSASSETIPTEEP